MYRNGNCYFWLPTAFTLSRLDATSASMINAVHGQLNAANGTSLKTDYQAGDTHEYYLRLNDFDMGGAAFTRDAKPGLSSCGPIYNFGYLSVNDIALMVAFGGDVEGFPVWFELDDPTATCPLSDSDETWEEWGVFGNSHVPVQHGDKWYRSSAVGESGQLLDASDWVPLMMAGSVTVKTQAQYLAIVAANAPESP